MATAAVTATGLAAGPWGWAYLIGAALVDNFVIAPALRGKGRETARAPRLADVPTGSNMAGAPRVWAIGPRIRVPVHTLWQDQKAREAQAATNKSGTNAQVRRVYFDALFALNDRKTNKCMQFVGNGKLLFGDTRNLVNVTSSAMLVSIASGRVVLTMSSTDELDFSLRFQAGTSRA